MILGDYMARFPEAEARIFVGLWICMSCGAKQRNDLRKPGACAKCGKNEWRIKHKVKTK